jgi:7 transmembrane receptor (rhodopsin family)
MTSLPVVCNSTPEETNLFPCNGDAALDLTGGAEDVVSPRYWTLVLVIIPALTLFGNSLVCLSVWREASLRSATNYFIVSLAVADIMVAVLVMPLAVYVEVSNDIEMSDLLVTCTVSELQ